jgi:hypothetical protein
VVSSAEVVHIAQFGAIVAVLGDCGMSGSRFGELPSVAAGCRGHAGSRDGSADQAFCLAVHRVVGAEVALRTGLQLAQAVSGGKSAEPPAPSNISGLTMESRGASLAW